MFWGFWVSPISAVNSSGELSALASPPPALSLSLQKPKGKRELLEQRKRRRVGEDVLQVREDTTSAPEREIGRLELVESIKEVNQQNYDQSNSYWKSKKIFEFQV